jgi:hypothetical protein
MFYKTIKDFLVKKYIKKRLSKGLAEVNNDPIKTIGLLIDSTHFSQFDKLINEFKKYSNGQFKINLLVYRKKSKKNEIIEYPFYSKSNIGIAGKINKGEIENFIDFPFDLLISYYDYSNPNLELVSALSKAKFKVGFESANQSINHFFVKTYVDEYEDFTKVLFDYLKILKKI